MFSFFKKKIKPQEVYDIMQNTIPNMDIKGFPLKSLRNDANFKISPYNWNKSDTCGFAIKTVCDGIRFEIGAFFEAKKKRPREITVRIILFDYDLQRSKEGYNMIKEKYKALNISQLGNMVTLAKRTPCNSASDVRNALDDFYSTWNNCGIYKLLVDISKIK